MVDFISPQPFDRFVESLASARYDDFRSRPGAAVESAAAFEEMREYLLGLYRGVSASASFVEDDGRVLDCIPTEQYLAIGGSRWGVTSVATPEIQPAPQLYAGRPSFAGSIDEVVGAVPRSRDRAGVEMRSRHPPGTIPMWRTTLEQLSRFSSLSAFCRKDTRADAGVAPAIPPKRYATGEQDIACLGGGSHINVWRPYAAPVLQGTFSQQWYLAGHESTLLQTVECGWHVDYERYGSTEPHFFVFTTRATYDPAQSFYNQDGGVFKLVDHPYVVPGTRLFVSQTDGTQVAYKMGFYLTGGAWFLFFDDQPVGYYPLAWFNGGPMASHATRIRFGGEVESRMPGWPPMGSGSHAAAGYGKAAYQRAAFVNPVGGGALNANLAEAGSTTGRCYTVDITNNSPSDWGTHLFFGGPGGQVC